jgi:putative transposase
MPSRLSGFVPRDFWLEDWEKQATIGFHLKNPLGGYRRLRLMILDANVAATSPRSAWQVLGKQECYRTAPRRQSSGGSA